jgi:6-phosphofructokinase 1
VIRAVVQRVHNAGGSCVGILEGWRGLVRGLSRELPLSETGDLVARGGTILGSSRTNPFKDAESDLPRLLEHYQGLGLDALVAIGGDDTLAVASRLHAEHGLAIVGVPKTIDNDLDVTDVTFGFDTAVNIVVEAIDRLRTTSESHRRVMVVETMGRQTGWIACVSGVAAAADYIFVPEVPIDLPHCVEVLKRRRAEGKPYGIVVTSEGARLPDPPDHAPHEHGRHHLGVAAVLAQQVERETGFETRSVVLGHIQRGGSPSAYDRVLATRFGLAAADLVLQARFGRVVALRCGEMVESPLGEGVTRLKRLDVQRYREASTFFQ